MSRIRRNFVAQNGWPERPRNTVPGDGTHGPGGIYNIHSRKDLCCDLSQRTSDAHPQAQDNGATGWDVSDNGLEDVTVWALACYTTGIDNNSYTSNSYVCRSRLDPVRGKWCGPLCPKGYHPEPCIVAHNSGFLNVSMLPAAAMAVVAEAGPR